MLVRSSSLQAPPPDKGSAGDVSPAQTSVPVEGDGSRVGDLAMLLSIVSSLVLIFRR